MLESNAFMRIESEQRDALWFGEYFEQRSMHGEDRHIQVLSASMHLSIRCYDVCARYLRRVASAAVSATGGPGSDRVTVAVLTVAEGHGL